MVQRLRAAVQVLAEPRRGFVVPLCLALQNPGRRAVLRRRRAQRLRLRLCLVPTHAVLLHELAFLFEPRLLHVQLLAELLLQRLELLALQSQLFRDAGALLLRFLALLLRLGLPPLARRLHLLQRARLLRTRVLHEIGARVVDGALRRANLVALLLQRRVALLRLLRERVLAPLHLHGPPAQRVLALPPLPARLRLVSLHPRLPLPKHALAALQDLRRLDARAFAERLNLATRLVDRGALVRVCLALSRGILERRARPRSQLGGFRARRRRLALRALGALRRRARRFARRLNLGGVLGDLDVHQARLFGVRRGHLAQPLQLLVQFRRGGGVRRVRGGALRGERGGVPLARVAHLRQLGLDRRPRGVAFLLQCVQRVARDARALAHARGVRAELARLALRGFARGGRLRARAVDRRLGVGARGGEPLELALRVAHELLRVAQLGERLGARLRGVAVGARAALVLVPRELALLGIHRAFAPGDVRLQLGAFAVDARLQLIQRRLGAPLRLRRSLRLQRHLRALRRRLRRLRLAPLEFFFEARALGVRALLRASQLSLALRQRALARLHASFPIGASHVRHRAGVVVRGRHGPPLVPERREPRLRQRRVSGVRDVPGAVPGGGGRRRARRAGRALPERARASGGTAGAPAGAPARLHAQQAAERGAPAGHRRHRVDLGGPA